MIWRLLTEQEINIVYEQHVKRDFPPEELPPFPPAMELIASGEGWFFGIFDKVQDGGIEGVHEMKQDGGTEGAHEVKQDEMNCDIDLEDLAAYMQVLKPEVCSYALLNYYAVLPAYRNQGWGERFLGELPVQLPKVQGILIEAEIPEKSEDAEIAQRRLGFYERVGAVNTMWQEQVYDAWYYVLVKLFADGEVGQALDDLQMCYQRLFTVEQYAQVFGLWDDKGNVISARPKHLKLDRDSQIRGVRLVAKRSETV